MVTWMLYCSPDGGRQTRLWLQSVGTLIFLSTEYNTGGRSLIKKVSGASVIL